MTRYPILFDDGAMTFPEEDLRAVADAAHALPADTKQSGGRLSGGGVMTQRASIVGTDGTAADGPFPEATRRLSGEMEGVCRPTVP